MAREGKAYLTELVESVICVPDAFRIKCGNDKFIFSIQSKKQETRVCFQTQTYEINQISSCKNCRYRV